MLIREVITIEASLEVVWSVFTCLEDWEKWNSVCQAAFKKDSTGAKACSVKPISQGDCISFAITPIIFPIRIRPRVTKCIPEKEVVWEGARLGIRAAHTFTFTRNEEGYVVVTSTEKLRGPGLVLSRLVFVPSRLHQLTRQLLFALKEEAESRALSGSAIED
ncbi:MAG: SRPBCC family protein [Syntrophobacteraceae bacterium]|nr:SRPBCC family protein [Syntrophobacteraceae bacterium]